MSYVQRNLAGIITGIFANLQPGMAEEFIADGSPALLPPFSVIKAAEFASFIATREKFISRMYGVWADFIALKTVAGDTSAASAKTVIDGLLGLTTDPTVTAATDIASLKLAMKARYNAVIGAALPEVLIAYKRRDA